MGGWDSHLCSSLDPNLVEVWFSTQNRLPCSLQSVCIVQGKTHVGHQHVTLHHKKYDFENWLPPLLTQHSMASDVQMTMDSKRQLLPAGILKRDGLVAEIL